MEEKYKEQVLQGIQATFEFQSLSDSEIISKIYAEIMGRLHSQEECLKLKHTTQTIDLLQKQMYLRSNVKIKYFGADLKKGKEVDVINTHMKIDHTKFVFPYYGMYGYF